MTALEVIAEALGGTYTARGDAVTVYEALLSAGFDIRPPTVYRVTVPDDEIGEGCRD